MQQLSGRDCAQSHPGAASCVHNRRKVVCHWASTLKRYSTPTFASNQEARFVQGRLPHVVRFPLEKRKHAFVHTRGGIFEVRHFLLERQARNLGNEDVECVNGDSRKRCAVAIREAMEDWWMRIEEWAMQQRLMTSAKEMMTCCGWR